MRFPTARAGAPGDRAGGTMQLLNRLEEYRAAEAQLAWEGTFSQYYEHVVANPAIARLSHARVYDMLIEAGVEVGINDRKHYKFFENELFGLDKPLEQLVDYFASAARRLEVRKRILLLMGPVGGGKSTIVSMLKRGLEAYTRTEPGEIYAISGCPMHEEPLHLIPHSLRPDFEREYGIYIEGDLCPRCHYDLRDRYEGRNED